MTDSPAPAALAVVPAEVADAGAFVQQTADALIGGIRSADTEVQDLMATWKGPAADAYLVGWEEVRQGAMDTLQALSSMADLLGVTAATFDRTDQDNAAALRAAGGLLGVVDTFSSAPPAGRRAGSSGLDL